MGFASLPIARPARDGMIQLIDSRRRVRDMTRQPAEFSTRFDGLTRPAQPVARHTFNSFQGTLQRPERFSRSIQSHCNAM
jgi:hypothetical protein